VRLGTLCTGITYRNIAALGKIVATLDVLSGGRAIAGLGIGWFEREHRLYGWDFPPRARRYELLEDAVQLLPLLWGKGSRPFEGRTVTVPEAICYPRPLQDRIPILVGGSGEQRTLRLVARYADACNLFGDAATVRHKVDVLHRHCADLDRDPADVTVTNLTSANVIDAGGERQSEGSGTVEEQVGRYREFAEAGVQTAIVSLPDVAEGGIERFVPVIAAFQA
jgi:alkanesulfonate monooxygenase SsuD/methylene tetrahydromethanopterin reductase-like flavin-dependent oxidoreductase (luciferase family)